MSTFDDPSSWLDGFSRLSPNSPPCPGFRPDEWRSLHAAAKVFLTEQASQAANLGWRGIDIFGVHPTVGGTRVDLCGAMMVGPAGEVKEITQGFMRFGNSRYFKTPMTGSVLVWMFGR